jgi:PilZ domain
MPEPKPVSIGSTNLRPRGRRWKKIRFPCNPDTACRLSIGSARDPELVRVRNLSGIGISLVLSRPIPPGTVVTVDLWNPSRHVDCQVPARVVSLEPDSAGHFIMEGAFSRELSNEALKGLL